MTRIKTTIALSVLAHGFALASIGFVLPEGARLGKEASTPVELVSLESGPEVKSPAIPMQKTFPQIEKKAQEVAPRPVPVQEAREETRPEPAGTAPVVAAVKKIEVQQALRTVEAQSPPQQSAGIERAAVKEDGVRPSAMVADAGGAFNSYVIQKIDRAKLYPNWARQRGYEGNVRVRFRLSSDGSVSEIKVVGPCECDILNKAACEAINRAAPFNDGPAIESGTRVMEVNIGFKLRK